MSSSDPYGHNPFAAPQAMDYATSPNQGRLEYAGFLTRFAAAFLDGIIVNIASFVIGMAVGLTMGASDATQLVAQIIAIVAQWFYHAAMESSESQATLGKMAVGIRVCDLNGQRISFGRATGRYFAKIPSMLILGIGFFMQPFTAKKQALHDMMAGCLIVKK